jgi:hypothetical protein
MQRNDCSYQQELLATCKAITDSASNEGFSRRERYLLQRRGQRIVLLLPTRTNKPLLETLFGSISATSDALPRVHLPFAHFPIELLFSPDLLLPAHHDSSLASHGNTSGIGGAGGGGVSGLKGDALASSGSHNLARVTSDSPRQGVAVAPSGGVVVGKKRVAALSGLDSSPGSIEDVEEAEPHEEKRRQPVKRACNECRQQKVRVCGI